ncbi:hypothetical protein D3C72_2195260 [compost metagenome]
MVATAAARLTGWGVRKLGYWSVKAPSMPRANVNAADVNRQPSSRLRQRRLASTTGARVARATMHRMVANTKLAQPTRQA